MYRLPTNSSLELGRSWLLHRTTLSPSLRKRVVGLATSHQLCGFTAVQYETEDGGFILSIFTGVLRVVLVKAYSQIIFW